MRRILRPCWTVFVVVVIAAAFLFSLARVLFPVVGQYRADIEAWIDTSMGQPVSIGDLQAQWRGAYPSLRLSKVSLLDPVTQAPVFHFDEVFIDLDLLKSLRYRRLEPGTITIVGLDLLVERAADGSIAVAGMQRGAPSAPATGADKVRRWISSRRSLGLEDTTVRWRDALNDRGELVFSELSLTLVNRGDRHQVSGSGVLPALLGRKVDIAADLRGDLVSQDSWRGEIYAKVAGLRLDQILGDTLVFGARIEQGFADAELWTVWNGGRIDDVRGDVRAYSLTASDAARAHSVEVQALSSRLYWQRETTGWAMRVERLVMSSNDRTWIPATVGVAWRETPEGAQIEAGADRIVIDDVLHILDVSQLNQQEWFTQLAQRRIRGELGDVYLNLKTPADTPPTFFVAAEIVDVSLDPVGKAPGVRGLDGRVFASGERAVIDLTSKDAALGFTSLFRQELPLRTLTGMVVAEKGAEGWELWSNGVRIDSGDIFVDAGFSLALVAGSAPRIDLAATFYDGNGAEKSRYLPVGIMHEKLVDWLDRGIVNGHVTSGGVVLRGPLDKFPFRNNEGRFEVRFNVEDGIVDYVPGWPRIEEIDAEVVFNEQSMLINARRAKTLNANLSNVTADIAQLMSPTKRELIVRGRADGPARDGWRHLTETPLRDKVGRFLEKMHVAGDMRLDLEVRVPLVKEQRPVRIKGKAKLSEASLLVKEWGVDVTKIAGDVSFTESVVSADNVDAIVMGQPAKVSFSTDDPAVRGGGIKVDARGKTSVGALVSRFNLPVGQFMEGDTDWHGQLLVLAGRRPDARTTLTVDLPLKGVSINLPPPLAKAPGESRATSVIMDFTDGKAVRVTHGENTNAIFDVAKDGAQWAIRRGEIRYASGEARLPGAGLRIEASLPELDLNAWLNAFSGGFGAPGSKLGDSLALEIAARTPRAVAFGYRFGAATGNARLERKAWSVDLDGAKLAGKVSVPPDSATPIVANLDRLYLDEPVDAESKAEAADPRQFRGFRLSSRDFRFGSWSLGKLDLTAEARRQGLHLSALTIEKESTRLEASGDWLFNGKVHTSSFDVVMKTEDMGQALTMFDYAGTIDDGRAENRFHAEWLGSPMDFGFDKLDGRVSLNITNGRVLEVDPGAGRIFGIFSLQTLPRRLNLDFSDLVEKGFAFDKVSGDFVIKQGLAHTENLVMEGPSASVSVTGDIDLHRHLYDQRVLVEPHVTSSLPLAVGVAVANPAAGAAAWLAEKLLRDPVRDLTQINYKVTGSWDAPQVEKLRRADLIDKSKEESAE